MNKLGVGELVAIAMYHLKFLIALGANGGLQKFEDGTYHLDEAEEYLKRAIAVWKKQHG